MVSDQEIASCVESLLRQSDPSGVATSVNVNDVVQQLEAKLGLNLSHKAGFIRDQINLLFRPPAPASRDHHAFQQQQQQHQHQLQQQFLAVHPHQLIQQHQIPASPFTHFPHQHELAFRCTPSVSVQPHHLLQQQQSQHAQQLPSAPSPAGVSAAVKQEGNVNPRSSASKGSKGSAATGAKRRGGPGGLSKVCGVSRELQAIVGEPTMSRTEIVKQLWAYIRKNNLQDPNNKRKIICNDELRLVFETDCTDMFKMNKLLAKHITPLEPSKEPGPDKKKLKSSEVPSSTEAEEDASPVLISDELAKFFGTGNREMFQSEALSRIWDYIKVYQLKDPLNPKMIRCDAKLQQLFGCESLSALGVSEMLGRHLFKQS
ncbi:unnamed protein product [Spirodela intermedia]|uniref:DM2 domain-containing protein n=1 Tax=Spirodela intermedia TaxID=51605 RepID=A0A7I8LF63_SPIIN|nr:unnamed protein product [Spirodela intermedia]